MGNDILSTDMLVGGIVRTAYNCYQFKDYVEGNMMLYDLNSFLLGFGVGLSNLPTPDNPTDTDVHDRLNPNIYHRTYRMKYANLVLKALGKYNRETIDAIKNKQYYPSITNANR